LSNQLEEMGNLITKYSGETLKLPAKCGKYRRSISNKLNVRH
jgi:hypothetical protein